MLLVPIVLMEKEIDMSSFKLLSSIRMLTASVVLFTVLLQVQQLMAADRVFFSGLVSRNEETHALDTTLIWGEFEGKIPPAVDSFKIYRKVSGAASYPTTPLAIVAHGVQSISAMNAFFLEAGENTRKEELITLLNKGRRDDEPDITSNNLASYLHGIIDPSSLNYNSYKRHLLIRYNRDVARAAGFAWIDRGVPAGSYTYMMIAVMHDASETNPLGISTVDTTAPAILPAPTEFEQVILSKCYDLNREIDQNKVYLNWHVPSDPSQMSHSAMIYGYDLFRSKRGDLGTPDFNQGIPGDIIKVNELPILTSGNTIPDTKDNYLAKDEDDSLRAGEVYYYYLVARDLNGIYSAAAGPLKAIVADRRGPVMPWNVHSYREMTGNTARLMLTWDDINTVNYLKQYKTGKTLCSVTGNELCFVPEGDSCAVDSNGDSRAICVDLDVQEYRIYRYDSPFAAKGMGTDSDGDGWFDENKNDQLPCDQSIEDCWPCDPDKPGTPPPHLVASLSGEDLTAARVTLASGKKIINFIDPFPQEDDKVYWYRLTSVDSNGNPSSLSPPARAALWDRTQPKAEGSQWIQKCDYEVAIDPDPGNNLLTIADGTEGAAASSFQLYENVYCGQQDQGAGMLGEYALIPGSSVILNSSDFTYYTVPSCDSEQQLSRYLLVRYYDANSRLIAESQPIAAPDFPDGVYGAVSLVENCEYHSVTGFGALIPDKPQVRVCAKLAQDECARVYQQIAGEMYPLESFCEGDSQTVPIPDGSAGSTCIEIEQQPGIVASLNCLGLRVFSKNHVGSGLHYFDCLSVKAGSSAAGLPAPVMSRMEPQGTAVDPGFKVFWSSLPDGVAAFSLEGRCGEELKQETIWNPALNGEGGSYSKVVSMSPGQIQTQWCFQVRLLDKTLRASPWSEEICREWGIPGTSDKLGWPTVPEPPTDSGLVAFFLEDAHAGALLLSDPMTVSCESSTQMDCVDSESYSCIAGRIFNSCGDQSFLCSDIKAANKYGDFIVYRQEENKEFIQVSPMVSDIHCFDDVYENEITAHLFDPLVYLVRLGTENRLIFVDWAPHKSGSKVRYQLVRLDKLTGEPIGSVVSEWVQF